MAISEGTGGLKTWVGDWAFTVDGGGMGTGPLRSNNGAIPAGSTIYSGMVEITVACLSGTGTIAFTVEGAADVFAAALQAALTVGRKSLIPVFSGATTVKTTVPRVPTITIATAAFTAGALRLHLVYL